MSHILRKFFRTEQKISGFLILVLLFILGSCGSRDHKNADKAKTSTAEEAVQQNSGSFEEITTAIFRIDTWENERILETGMGFFIGSDLAVTRLSFFESANKAEIKPFNEENSYQVTGFAGVDRLNDLILLKIDGIARTPVELLDSILPNNEKTTYPGKPTTNVVPLHPGTVLAYENVQGSMLYRVSNQLRSKSAGSPMFDENKRCMGLAFMQISDYEAVTFVIPSVYISDLLQKQETVKPLSDLNSAKKILPAGQNNKIKGLIIETDLGNISIKLYNNTPQYRDNFIKLVRENYFDGLLIHRVIKGFGIQSGAADTRFATKDDVVGWKGPGYTLPAHIVPGMYHKRGVIGSPRKPDRDNSKQRSDGSQFYIVTGRTYSDIELNELEKEIHFQYTEEQRNTYKTIGGAPHLDGSYTIFGEVLEGLELADRISEVEVDSEYRPKTDIRVKKIRILE